MASTVMNGQKLASMEAQISSGPLMIDPASVAGPFAPISGSVTTTGKIQRDAVVFQLEQIRVVDLNGDGLGFSLTASPTIMTTEGEARRKRRELLVGTTPGFFNSSDTANTVFSGDDPNYVQYLNGDGGELFIDYEVRFDVPRFVQAGIYTGTIAFSVSAN